MSRKFRILIVDDEAELRRALAEAFEAEGGYECVQATDGEEAMARLREGDINLVLTDIAMPQGPGDELLRAARKFNPDIPVLVMTGHGSIDSAVELLRLGADDYITKPFRLDELRRRVSRALERLTLLEEIRTLRQNLEEKASNERIIGNSPAILRVLRQLPSIARSDASVILNGESGTGKEVIARAIHLMSPRSARAFVTVNCGALPETLLENELFGHMRGAFTDAHVDYAGLIREADGGTLLLDEIAEMSPATQVKLLHFLQNKQYRPLGSTRVQRVDVRIIAATNRNLRKAIVDGRFREDLFYRLNIIPLSLPPLRERKEDIPLLVRHFLDRLAADGACPVTGFSPLAIQKLMGYDWPGNVRELENKVQQVVALATTDIIQPEQIELPTSESLTGPDGRPKSFKDAKREVVDAFEVGYVSRLLAATGGNISEAARLARKHRRAFWEIMKKHGLRGRTTSTEAAEDLEGAELVGAGQKS